MQLMNFSYNYEPKLTEKTVRLHRPFLNVIYLPKKQVW